MENKAFSLKGFLLTHKKGVCVVLAIIIGIIAISLLSTYSTKQGLIGQLETYLTEECRLSIEKVTLEKRYDYFGDFDGYDATVYCNNLDIHSYDEMTSIDYYYKLEDIYIDKFVFNGDTYHISSRGVNKNGNRVYTKDEEDYTHVTLKCDHEWGDWKQDEPCDTFERIRCIKCDEKKEQRIAEDRHNCDSNGVCLDCKEKIKYSKSEIDNIVSILRFDVGEYNGEALSEIKIEWKNLSHKEITSTEFAVQAKYSDETDITVCESSTNLKYGEIGGKGKCWETLWPSGMFGEKIVRITINYTDGSKVNITGDSCQLAYTD